MKDFSFSVIMAVFNVSKYLDEAVESLLNQTFPFEKVQLILVDDGSTDGSGELCDRWQEKFPENVLALHKENGRQASARNMGLEYAAGHYINFLDGDDKLSPETLQIVFDFFTEHEKETDLVAVPIIWFEAQTGEHWQNEKFKQGCRVIDLTKDYKHQLAHAPSVFFKAEAAKKYRFDTELFTNEDFKFILYVISEKQTLGVVDGCSYFYRKRCDSTSTMDSKGQERSWYTNYFDHFAFWAVDHFRKLFGDVPLWGQYALLCDLFWRIIGDHYPEMRQILTESEIKDYYVKMRKYAGEFDDRMILTIPFFSGEHRWWMLKLKHPDAELQPVWQYDRVMLQYQGIDVIPADDLYTEVSSVAIIGDRVIVRGFCHVLPGEPDGLKIDLVSNDQWYICKTVSAAPKDICRFGETVTKAIGFEGEVPLPGQRYFEIGIGMEYPEGLRLKKKELHPGPNLPYNGLSYTAASLKGYKYLFRSGMICFVPCGTLKEKLKRELGWDLMALRGKAFSGLICRCAGFLLGALKRKPVWLISDRYEKADDNGEAFFDYLIKEKQNEVSPYFVLSKESKDFQRLKKTGRVIPAFGIRHKLLSVISDMIISSEGREDSLHNPFRDQMYVIRDLWYAKPFVFLQHGITKDDMSDYLCIWNQGFYGLVTACEPEYRSIIQGNYGYKENEVWLTGFARYDNLVNDPQKIITVIPTWRKGLGDHPDPRTGAWTLNPDFVDSDYCRFYRCLLSDRRLIEAADRLGYSIQFRPHPNLGQYAALFGANASVELLDEGTSYRDIFAKSALIVTDYSSVAFDFAYLEKPVIYAQFDRDEIFKGSHTYKKGYFDYERDGFGPVTETVDETVDRIIAYMEDGCRMDEKYRQRADEFFAFHDRKNCERIFNEIAASSVRH